MSDDFTGYTLEDWRRFLEKVELMGEVTSEYVNTPCWHWVGAISDSGYGTFSHPDGKTMRSHRESYKFCMGPIPKGHVILHICDNPVCVNPFHHVTGTQSENMQDCVKKGRHRNGKSRGRTGEQNSRSTFTEREVRRIKLEYAHGMAVARIAKKHKRPLSTIKDICSGRTWDHVVVKKQRKKRK